MRGRACGGWCGGHGRWHGFQRAGPRIPRRPCLVLSEHAFKPRHTLLAFLELLSQSGREERRNKRGRAVLGVRSCRCAEAGGSSGCGPCAMVSACRRTLMSRTLCPSRWNAISGAFMPRRHACETMRGSACSIQFRDLWAGRCGASSTVVKDGAPGKDAAPLQMHNGPNHFEESTRADVEKEGVSASIPPWNGCVSRGSYLCVDADA